jgi:hypothetical protein
VLLLTFPPVLTAVLPLLEAGPEGSLIEPVQAVSRPRPRQAMAVWSELSMECTYSRVPEGRGALSFKRERGRAKETFPKRELALVL